MMNQTMNEGGIPPKKRSRLLLLLALTVFLSATSVFCLIGCEDYSKDLAYSYNDAACTATVIGIGTFDGEELVIPSTTVRGYPVTAIDKGAFVGCQTIKSVVIPDSVKTIGKEAFYGCPSLTRVTIGKGVQEIGHEAFGGLSHLTELEYNAIECADMDDVFIGCGTPEGLNVTIGADVKRIPATMFYPPNNELHYGLMYYSSVASVVFADGSVCESIGAKAFRETDIRSIVLPDSITTIEEYAFADCQALTDVHMPASLDSIGDFAFQDCSKLPEMDLAATALTKIGKKAFEGCVSLAAIEIPSTLTTVDQQAFLDDTALERVNYHGTIDQWANINFRNPNNSTIIFAASNPLSYAGDLYINGELVTEARITTAEVSPYAFNCCTNLVRVVIGENVEYIGQNAFSECKKLVEVVNKSQMTITRGSDRNGLVAYYALAVKEDEATDIKKTDDGFLFYTADDGGHHLLAYDGTETDLIFLPENYKGEAYQVYSYAFKRNAKITSVVIPDGVTKINEDAFIACKSLKNVVIGDVTDVCKDAFRGCKRLKSLTIGEGVERIYQAAFCDCVSLREIYFNAKDCNVSADSGVFKNCGSDGDGIKLTIGKQVTQISKMAFYKANIAEVIFEEGSVLESIGDEAFKGSSFTSIRLPASIKSIGKGAFYSCSSLSSVQFEEGSRLEVIGAEAFVSSSLTSITIPKSVVSIGKKAFLYLEMETVTFEAPDGWYYAEKENATSGQALSLNSPSSNARYLCYSYFDYYWYRKA